MEQSEETDMYAVTESYLENSNSTFLPNYNNDDIGEWKYLWNAFDIFIISNENSTVNERVLVNVFIIYLCLVLI